MLYTDGHSSSYTPYSQSQFKSSSHDNKLSTSQLSSSGPPTLGRFLHEAARDKVQFENLASFDHSQVKL